MASFGRGLVATSSWPDTTVVTTTNYIDPHALEFLGGVVFGSTALGCTTIHSDFDIATDLATVDAMGGVDMLRGMELNLLEYFAIVPLTDAAVLVRSTSTDVDIIVFEYKSTLAQFKLAVEATKLYDPLLLADKPTRIKIFENELLVAGFVPRKTRHKLYWTICKLTNSPFHTIPPVQLEPTLTL